MWALPALMALALLPTVKNTLSGVCLSFHVAGTASIIRAVKTVQSLTIVTEWRINMSKKCVCGNEMFTVFMCRKCEHLLYVEEDENFPQKLGKIAATGRRSVETSRQSGRVRGNRVHGGKR
mgnify:FL=1